MKSKAVREYMKSRSGGLSLEAALILPLFIIVIIFMIQSILLIRIEIIASNALDHTADELSLLIPVFEMVVESENIERAISDIDMGLQENFDIKLLIKDAMLDFGSSLLLNQIIDERFIFWMQKLSAEQKVSIENVVSTKIQLEISLEQHFLVLNQHLKIRTVFGSFDRTLKSAVPVWNGDCDDRNLKDEANERDSIWLLDNFGRGKKIREIYGSNLPFNYPVIASFNNGSAVSMTSIDLTAPSYMKMDNVLAVIKGKLVDLSEFKGYNSKTGDYPDISADDIKFRKLLLIIPENCPEEFNQSFRNEIAQLGNDYEVQVQIVSYGISRRFESNPDDLYQS
jgi:hypothetical protein